jgi:ABC-type Na+ efflux pump permease subunit
VQWQHALFVTQPADDTACAPRPSVPDRPHETILALPGRGPSGAGASRVVSRDRYSVVGEREQGTLEPLLTTPIRQHDLILGKAAAIMIPTAAIAYTVFGLFLAAVRPFAKPAIADGIFGHGPILVAYLVFTPLPAGWAIWVGMAVSTRVSDVRVAGQLSMVANLPPLAVTALLATNVIDQTLTTAALFAGGLVVLNLLASRGISGLFDRERLVTGARAVEP